MYLNTHPSRQDEPFQQIMLCGKNSVIFQSNAPYTCTLCTFWGSGITPKTPGGGHASLGTTQQSQRVALIATKLLKFTPLLRLKRGTICDLTGENRLLLID